MKTLLVYSKVKTEMKKKEEDRGKRWRKQEEEFIEKMEEGY